MKNEIKSVPIIKKEYEKDFEEDNSYEDELAKTDKKESLLENGDNINSTIKEDF